MEVGTVGMKKIKSPSLPFTPHTRKPMCPEHQSAMTYNPVIGYWCCPIEKCKVRAQKKEQDALSIPKPGRQMELFPPADGIIEPKTAELFIETDPDSEEERYVLGLYRDNDEPLYVDISSNVEMLIGDEPNATLCLTFLRVRR